MRVLASRTYRVNGNAEKKVLRFGQSHPAKWHPGLVRDLFLRYTKPGQTIFDPFGGRGGSLVGITLGRNVLLNELEPAFVAYCRQNYEYLKRQTLPGIELGWAEIHQGDSRRLDWLPAAEDTGRDSACVSSPSYGGSEVGDGRKYNNATNGGKGRGNRKGGSYEQSGNIANLKHAPGAVLEGCLSSPPYGDLADRCRAAEPNQARAIAKYGNRYGHGSPTRHVDGYGSTDGQIGRLPHVDVALSSPPYGTTFSDWDATSNAAREGQSVLYADERHTGARQNIGTIPYYDSAHESKRSPAPPAEAETYTQAVFQVYRELFRVIIDGGVLVLGGGDFVRDGTVGDLCGDTIRLCEAAGWLPVEQWQHQKASVSFWRRLHHRQRPDVPVVDYEWVLVFVKKFQGWPFTELEPTTAAPVEWTTKQASTSRQLSLVDATQLGLT